MQYSHRYRRLVLIGVLGFAFGASVHGATTGKVNPAEDSVAPRAGKVVKPPAAPKPAAPVAPSSPKPLAQPTAQPPRTAPVTGPAPGRGAPGGKVELRVLSPNGGETFRAGARVQIRWMARGVTGPGAVHLLRDGRKVATLAPSVNLALGTTAWQVPASLPAASGYTVQVETLDRRNSDSSDRPFTLAAGFGTGRGFVPSAGRGTGTSGGTTTGGTPQPQAPSLSFLAPTANSAWCTNQPHEFRWQSTLPAGSAVTIDLMRSDGTTLWQNVATNTTDDGNHTWAGLTDAQFASGSITLRPRIKTADNSVVKVGEYLHFGKPLLLNAPQSNHTWRTGSSYDIRWTQLCELPAPVTLELLNAAQQPVLTIAESLPTTGNPVPRAYSWTVPGNLAPGTYHMRVRTADNQLARSGSFTIANPVTVQTSSALTFTSPTTSTGWCTNEPHEFRWNTTLPADTTVKIDLLNSTGEAVWRSIVANTPNNGSYTWAGLTDAQFVSGSITLRPRIATLDNSQVTVGEYLHFGKRLMLDAPKSNYTWQKGSSYDIRWTQICGLPSSVTLELLDAAHQPVATVASGLPGTASSLPHSFHWTVPGDIAPGTYYMRVRSADQQYSREGSFTIAEPSQF